MYIYVCVCAYIMVYKYIPIYIYIYSIHWATVQWTTVQSCNQLFPQSRTGSSPHSKLSWWKAQNHRSQVWGIRRGAHQLWMQHINLMKSNPSVFFFPDGLLLPQTLSLDLCSSWKLSKLDRFNEGDRTKLGLSRLSVPSIWASSAFDWPPLEQGAIELERSWRRWSAITLDCEKVWTSYRRS